jgi:hypothetical protein
MSHRTRDGTRVNRRAQRTGSPRKADGSRERQSYKPPELANPGDVIKET